VDGLGCMIVITRPGCGLLFSFAYLQLTIAWLSVIEEYGDTRYTTAAITLGKKNSIELIQKNYNNKMAYKTNENRMIKNAEE
jgi:hypothetical protein